MARATPSRRRNFPGLGWLTRKQTTYQRSRGEASHSAQAYRAGVKSGDTGLFDSWLRGKRLDKAPGSIQKSLEAAYRRGVERAGVAERVKAAKAERATRKKEQKRTALSSYKGVRLYKLGGGEYSTSIDQESRFDSLQDAKDFIRSWKEGHNPCARTLKSKVSDRAKRYRANQKSCRPSGLKKCKLCSSRSDVMVDHVDGDESNGRKSNLRWLCRSCNNTLGAEMARTGQGRRTVQYNPAHKGAQTLGEYMQAVLQHTRGAHDAAGKIIHETPKSRRREFASEIWARRESHGTARPGSGRTGQDEPDWVTNPAMSPEQYRLAQAVLSRTAKKRGMPVRVAREIVERTPAHLRSEYSRNPAMQFSTEYHLGYNLGQADRQSAQLRKTPDELHATFTANFGPGNAMVLPSWESFEQAYQAGYGGQIGAAAPNPNMKPDAVKVYPSTRRQGKWDVFVGGIHRATKATLKGAESLAKRIRDANPAAHPNPEKDSEEYTQAKKIAELFHGRPVKEEIIITEGIKEHDWLWRIGPLVKLKIRTLTKRNATLPFHQTEEGMVHLFCSPDGRQFYLRGGDQELNLEALGMGEGTEWHRDHMLIGEAKEITYRDKKAFHRFKLTDYYHKLGEVTKKKPILAYDAFAHKMQIVGGQYKVETDDLVDGMSPGIVN